MKEGKLESMNAPKVDELDHINFLIAAQRNPIDLAIRAYLSRPTFTF